MVAAVRLPGVEWPTVGLVAATYLSWMLALAFVPVLPVWCTVLWLAVTLTLHSSLQHEVIHGHPLSSRAGSVALVWLPLGLAIPYERFRDQHLAHHRNARLTDPYDDPETCYLDPARHAALPAAVRALLAANNTLAGRMVLGPAIGLAEFWRADWALLRAGAPAIRAVWVRHGLGVAAVLGVVAAAGLPLPAYLAACYGALSILKIRTYAEHQAHLLASGRSVIIEDRGPLAFLFLNNNLHAVHHAHPGVPWYRLPALYQSRRAAYLRRNRGYHFPSYTALALRHFWRAKEPVAHPLWRPEGAAGPRDGG